MEENEIPWRNCFFFFFSLFLFTDTLSISPDQTNRVITSRGLISTKRKNVRDILSDNRKRYPWRYSQFGILVSLSPLHLHQTFFFSFFQFLRRIITSTTIPFLYVSSTTIHRFQAALKWEWFIFNPVHPWIKFPRIPSSRPLFHRLVASFPNSSAWKPWEDPWREEEEG